MIIFAGNRFFRIFGKIGPRIQNLFSLKPSRDQDRANKKRFSQIGPAALELLRDRHTDGNPYYFVVLIKIKICIPKQKVLVKLLYKQLLASTQN